LVCVLFAWEGASAKKVSAPAPILCGTYGPLQWFNQGSTQLTTAIWGSPLAIYFGFPVLMGCTPKGATIGRDTKIFFNYSKLDSDLVEFMYGDRVSNFTASYQSLGANDTVITYAESEGFYKTNFSYQPRAPHKLLNLTLEKLGRFSQVISRKRHFLPMPHFRYSGSPGADTTFTDVYSYTAERFPEQANEITYYEDDKKFGEVQITFTAINHSKSDLITKEAIIMQDHGQNETSSYNFTYSVELNLMTETKHTDKHGSLTVTFTYDDKNRLTKAQTSDRRELDIEYSSNDDLKSVYDSRFGNITFSY